MDTLKLRAGLQSCEPTAVANGKLYAVAHPALLSRRQRQALIIGVIALVCAIAARGIGKGEFDYNVDEAQHAVTGLFVADVFRDLPLRHPMQYAFDYYAQYPAVAMVHWPPLFYVVEGLSFLSLGAGVIAARLTVIIFTVLLLYQWFRLVEERQDSYTAAVSTAVLGLLPTVLLFEKTVMLEIPSLALAVAAIRCWIRYLDAGRRADIYAFALWLAAALLCKQNDVFVLLFCLLTLATTGKWKWILKKDALQAAAICALLTGPFYLLMLINQGKAEMHNLASHQMSGFERLTYYLRVLPITFTWPMLGLSVLGIVFSRRWNRKGQVASMICWLAAGYLTFTFFGQREPRFAIYFFPPLVYFAVGFLMRFFAVPRVRVAMQAVALLMVGFLAVEGWGYERPYISGYKDVAAHLIQTYGSGIVLFDGNVPGNFVFQMRALDPRRQFLVLRKSLFVSDIRQDATSEELLHSRDELLDIFKRDGIRFVVIQQPVRDQVNSQRILREAMESGQFRLLQDFPIDSNEPQWQGARLLLYENVDWAPPGDKYLRIRMLTLSHDIVVPLNHFDFVKGQNGLVGKP